MITREDLLTDLAAHVAADTPEAESIERLRELLRRSPDPFTRDRPEHVTGSAVVVDRDHQAFLLVHHRRLDRWLQPGGHVEEQDRSVFDTAMREAREETGIEKLEAPFGPRILDLDVHPIPARHGKPAHVHFDIRYLLTASNDPGQAQVEEVLRVGWFSLPEALVAGVDESLARALKRAASWLTSRESATT